MTDWTEPVQRAAVWLVATFTALGAALLTGVQLANFDWSKAKDPIGATVAIAACLAVVALVVLFASRVLTVKNTTLSLKAHRQKALGRAYKAHGPAPTWPQIADKDWLLTRIYTHDGVKDDLATVVANAGAGVAGADAKLAAVLASADSWQARRAYRDLLCSMVLGIGCLLVGLLVWLNLSRADQPIASAANPIPVQLSVADRRDPAGIMGAGCSARVLDGVAVAGDPRNGQALVAFPAQGSCSGAMVRVTAVDGILTRK